MSDENQFPTSDNVTVFDAPYSDGTPRKWWLEKQAASLFLAASKAWEAVTGFPLAIASAGRTHEEDFALAPQYGGISGHVAGQCVDVSYKHLDEVAPLWNRDVLDHIMATCGFYPLGHSRPSDPNHYSRCNYSGPLRIGAQRFASRLEAIEFVGNAGTLSAEARELAAQA